MVQIEIAFMNFFQQISMWDSYAALPGADTMPDPERIRRASTDLQTRSKQTMELVQKYTEGVDEEARANGE